MFASSLKFVFFYALLSLGIFRSNKKVSKDRLLDDNFYPRNLSHHIGTIDQLIDSKNCEYIQVFIRRNVEEVDKNSSLRKLTILNQQNSNKIAILDLSENDLIDNLSGKKNCKNLNKCWSVCLRSHQNDSSYFNFLNMDEKLNEFLNQTQTTEINQKSIKIKRENFKIQKKLTKRSTKYRLSNNSTELKRFKKGIKMTKSEFLLINCDYIDSNASHCKMIKLMKKGCFSSNKV